MVVLGISRGEFGPIPSGERTCVRSIMDGDEAAQFNASVPPFRFATVGIDGFSLDVRNG